VVSIGTASPAGVISQEQSAAVAQRLYPFLNGQARLLPALFRRTEIRQRASVLVADDRTGAGTSPAEGPPRGDSPAVGPSYEMFEPAPDEACRGPSTSGRMDRYARDAGALAMAAARDALTRGGVVAREVTHLVTVSCTGFGAPGVDATLIEGLGLRATVQRTHIGFMGCHGAINALRVAKGFAEAGGREDAAVVLVVCVELCSLHFQYGARPDQMVANALFADGAAAAVVTARGEEGPRLASTGSLLVPGSREAMTWRVGDHGFEMTLSARVPDLIREHLPAFLREWLGGLGIGVEGVGSWAIHPGGPRVISTVVEALGLPPGAATASRRVLAERGNMSSPTVLVIARALLDGGGEGLPMVGLAFGPGLVIEAFLLTY
jgi:predicted naringenin-chalcone synthase